MVIDVSLENPNYLEECLEIPEIDGIFLPSQRISPEDWRETAERVREHGKYAVLSLPFVFRGEAERYLTDHTDMLRDRCFDGFLVRNIDEAAFLRAEKIPGRKITDAGMYVWNREAAAVMRDLGADRMTFPCECRRRELEDIGFKDMELVIYGRIPLMISAQCTKKTSGRCLRETPHRSDGWMDRINLSYLRDRRQMVFPEDSHCRFCTSVIYNSVPLWLLDCVPEKTEAVRFHFTDEEEGEPSRLIRRFLEGDTAPAGEFTRGHFTRGVE